MSSFVHDSEARSVNDPHSRFVCRLLSKRVLEYLIRFHDLLNNAWNRLECKKNVLVVKLLASSMSSMQDLASSMQEVHLHSSTERVLIHIAEVIVAFAGVHF
eukprot:scaffold230323_cov78-Cyclotella_meneghiniana.AAC.2